MAIRPATPGTVVVGIATVLLIIVSISAPIWKEVFFLKATVGGTEIRLGCWGYCGSTGCTKTTLGYSLDLQQLFDFNGVKGVNITQDIPNTLVKWLTYVLILHPVAGAFALVSTILGLLAHIRGFSGTCCTTLFASFGASIALIAFAFDLGLFIVAKKRIESRAVGGTAEFGAALWLTLVAAILLLTSSCFFGCGNRIVSERRTHKKETPLPDAEYGAKMRDTAFQNKMAMDNLNNYNKHGKDGSLPQFAEYGESIPLNSVQRDTDDDWDDTGYGAHQQPRYPGGYAAGGGQRDDGSMVSGVGEGYGRRNDGPVAPSSASVYTAGGAGVGAGYGAAGAGGAGAMLAANARADRGMPQRSTSGTTEPFVGMNAPPRQLSPPPPSGSPVRQSQYDYNGGSQMPQPAPYTDPYAQPYTSHPQYDASYGAQPSTSAGSGLPFANAPAAAGSSHQYPSEKSLSSYYTPDNMTPSASAGSVPQQTHYVQNRSASPPPPSVQAPSYVTHQPYGAQDQQQQQWNSGGQAAYDHQYGYGGAQSQQQRY